MTHSTLRNIRRSINRTVILALVPLTLTLGAKTSQGQVVLNNLDQPNLGNYVAGDQVGAAISVGAGPISLVSIITSESAFGQAVGEFFSINVRNGDGTVGGVISSDFTMNFDSGTGLNTITPNSPFVLASNTSYWLVLNSAAPGSIVAAPAWDYTPSTTFTSNGITMPATMTSYYTFNSPPQYFDLADGPQLIQINGVSLSAIPEPGPMFLGAAVTLAGLGVGFLRKAQRKGRPATK